mmetsp:Transcript_98855/g.255540  ORF Transcript_98855/g.255540 Transcript_98855/m.255540 type:complete len:80 (-) Transcript_98855:207-446(-)
MERGSAIPSPVNVNCPSHNRPCHHAQPPAAVSQPLPVWVQHHAFLATDQPAFQLAKPALQSYTGAVEFDRQPVPTLSQQ